MRGRSIAPSGSRELAQGRVFSNAIWNVVNGTSGAVVAVVVPPFLTKSLSPEAFGAWALALQLGTYVSLFGFGIQVAVGRFIAHYEARDDFARRDGIVATAFWALTASATFGFAILAGIAANIRQVVPDLAPELVGETQLAILLVSLALAANLPASTFAAVFIGRQESKIAAMILGTGRLAIAAGLIVVGRFGDLALLGLVYAGVTACTVAALWFAWRTRTHDPTIRFASVSRRVIRELWHFCLSITLWNLSMLLVNGLDLIIVGRFDYRATAYYAVCVALVTLVVGTLSSLSNALIPEAARIPDCERPTILPDLLLRSSRLISGAALLIATPLIFTPDVILSWWLGPAYAAQSSAILALLTMAALLRNTMLPYVTIAIGVGYQARMTVTPLVEGAIAVVLSVILVQAFGAVGIASAKITAGLCGVVLLLAQHALHGPLGGLRRLTYFRGGLLRSAITLVIIAVLEHLIAANFPHLPGGSRVVIIIAISTISIWWVALAPGDRALVYSQAGRWYSGLRGLSKRQDSQDGKE